MLSPKFQITFLSEILLGVLSKLGVNLNISKGKVYPTEDAADNKFVSIPSLLYILN